MIAFHPITMADREAIREIVYHSECRNCDLNFVNLMSWRFYYDTEVAIHEGWLLFRFKTEGHNAYLAPTGKGDWAKVIRDMIADATELGHPFLMLGVTEYSLNYMNDALPNYFFATADRSYTDYIYNREALATLAGKKLQQKRNHANKFQKLYPDYEFLPLTQELIPECLRLRELWQAHKEDEDGRLSPDVEKQSIEYAFSHWEELGCQGGVIRINGKIAAFTYGGPVNYDTFDVCVEKADYNYEGIYAVINRDFVRSLPEQYIHINREEDLGIPGLRRAKESYKPELLLHKFTIMLKHPLGEQNNTPITEPTE